MDTLPEKKEKEGEEGSSYSLPHPVWTKEELENVTITHNVPQTKVDKVRRERGRRGRDGRDGRRGRGRGRGKGVEEESDRERGGKEKYTLIESCKT